MSLVPPHLTLPALALHREEEGRRASQGEREREKLTAAFEPSTALMAGDIVVIEVDPWDPSDVTVEML